MYGQGVIPNDWTGEYCCYAVNWPNSPQWLAVLRGVLTIPSQGRFWDKNTGTITEAQEVIRQTFDDNLHLQEVIMACGDPALSEIALAMQAIAQSLNNRAASGCCNEQGTGGSGQYPPAIGTDPEGNPAIDPPPNGYDSWEQFFAQKCEVAAWIVHTMQQDLGNMALVKFTEIGLVEVIAALIAILLLPISASVIIALAGFLITAGSIIIVTTALSIINDNEADLICALYSGESASDSSNAFLGAFSDLVDSGVSDPVENFSIKTLVTYLLSTDALNMLYERVTDRNFPDYDCSECTCPSFLYTFAPGQPAWDTTTEPTWVGVRESNQPFALASERMEWAGAGSATTSWVSVSWEQVLEDMGVLPFTGSIDISMNADSSGLLDFFILGEYPGGVFYIMDAADTLNGPATKSISAWDIHDDITDTDIERVWVMVDGTADGWIDNVTIGRHCA